MTLLQKPFLHGFAVLSCWHISLRELLDQETKSVKRVTENFSAAKRIQDSETERARNSLLLRPVAKDKRKQH
jgi:hypothetical protein